VSDKSKQLHSISCEKVTGTLSKGLNCPKEGQFVTWLEGNNATDAGSIQCCSAGTLKCYKKDCGKGLCKESDGKCYCGSMVAGANCQINITWILVWATVGIVCLVAVIWGIVGYKRFYQRKRKFGALLEAANAHLYDSDDIEDAGMGSMSVEGSFAALDDDVLSHSYDPVREDGAVST
jgi:hypothetical protein